MAGSVTSAEGAGSLVGWPLRRVKRLGRWLGDAAPAFGAAVQRVILNRESSPKLAFTAV
jgi:hypothetical protein